MQSTCTHNQNIAAMSDLDIRGTLQIAAEVAGMLSVRKDVTPALGIVRECVFRAVGRGGISKDSLCRNCCQVKWSSFRFLQC